jgi:hypothetical protein
MARGLLSVAAAIVDATSSGHPRQSGSGCGELRMRPRGSDDGGRPSSRDARGEVDAWPPPSSIDLYWLPLGAGGRSVRLNGRVFEALAARVQRRERCDLYHAALEVRVPEGLYVIEQAPVGRTDPAGRGVVAEGPVGARAAGCFRLFRYEIRRWRDGVIPDVAEAVESPRRLSENNAERARRLLDLVPEVPTAVWGRDELAAGEMWNSNSVVSWLIARAGLDAQSIRPPQGGRAPGWRAGIVVAGRGS